MISLPVKYRPKTFESCLSQGSTIKILQKQLEKRQFTNCYLFAGSSGCGKTTLARIFANEINNHQGQPIEIDAASNNGVDAVRTLIDGANQRAIDSEYKIYIIDECHAITTAGWQAFLKCIEEPPMYTIFMFCTTNPEKLPDTIKNRMMRFNISKVPTDLIKNRLKYICQQENFSNYEDACDYLSKISSGCVRQAIAYLEQCSHFSTDLNINNVVSSLGNFSYSSFFDLTNAVIDGDEGQVLAILDYFYDTGKDLKTFIDQYLEFVLDLTKYCIFQDLEVTKIPSNMLDKVKYSTGIENNISYYNNITEKVLNIKNTIKNDVNNKVTIEVMFITMCRGN